MSIYLLDHSLKVDVFYDKQDCDYNDNICISFFESCPEDEKIFWADEVNIYLNVKEARQLAEALLAAVERSSADNLED